MTFRCLDVNGGDSYPITIKNRGTVAKKEANGESTAVPEVIPEYRAQQIREQYQPTGDAFTDALMEELPESIVFGEAGDRVVGTIMDITVADNGSGFGPAPVITLQVEHGATAHNGKLEPGSKYGVWLFHATMISQAQQSSPQLGERIGIVYNGERSPKSGTGPAYKDFRFRVDRTRTAFNWSDVAGKTFDR